jgi:hypothetical protein
MLYICMEWCLQAHLSTEDYDDAMKGLKNARRFRRLTYRARWPASAAVLLINRLMQLLRMRKSHERKTLVWTKNSRYTPSIRQPVLAAANALHTLAFAKTDTDEEGGLGNGSAGGIFRPDAALTVDRGEKRGSVTMQPLLGRAQRLENSADSSGGSKSE